MAKRAARPAPMPRLQKTPGIVPQPRHRSAGKFQPKPGVYKPQAMPYMPTSTDGQ